MKNSVGLTMELRNKPDFTLACQIATETLLCCEKQNKLPISVYGVIEEVTDLNLMSFSDARSNGIEPPQMGSESGILAELNGWYYIFYNEKECRERIAFDCAHELGHYKLGHDMKKLEEFKKRDINLFNELYGVCEVEANFFAAQLLMPEQVLIELNKRGCGINKSFLMENFGASLPAAEKRLQTLRKVYNWNSYRSNKGFEYDDIIIQKFKQLIVFLSRNNYDYEEEERKQKERDGWY